MAPLPSDIYGSFLPLVEQTAVAASTSASSGSAVVSLHALIDADQRAECRQAVLSLPPHSPLLESGCHRSGMTALHRAVENDWPDVVEALLSRGADPQAKCALYDGDTVLQLARRFQAKECVTLLEVATANHSSAAALPSAPAAQ
jgi:ankyrin repeat protein